MFLIVQLTILKVQTLIREHTYQAKRECPVLQLICNTYQADSLYRVINHLSMIISTEL